jgi:hypothetical protein
MFNPGCPPFFVVRKDDVPAVHAVTAAVGDDVARLKTFVGWLVAEQEAAAAAVDADDLGRRVHDQSLGAWQEIDRLTAKEATSSRTPRTQTCSEAL